MSLKVRTLLVLVIGTVLGMSLSLSPMVLAEREGDAGVQQLPWQEAALLAEVLERVKRDYVDAVDDHELIESAIRGMIAELDPHSAFLGPDEYEEIRISTTGNYSGVGLEVSMEDGRVRVVAPIDGTPAARAGLLPGDVIVSIDGVAVDDGNLNDTILRMRGRVGTPVAIEVAREREPEHLHFHLTRAHVHVPSVKYRMLEPGYGYLRLTHFTENTSDELRNAVEEMSRSRQSLRGIVLDLRNNPGGVLDSAIEVSDAFLDDGVIVSAEGRADEAEFTATARPGDVLGGAEIVLLVNAGSASASEIVAGALQDHQRAIVIGTSTFGKGSVQTVMPLSNGRAIKLTTSRYYTPSGDSIHDRGIEPDVFVELDEADVIAGSELLEAAEAELLAHDRQLDVALSTLKERTRLAHSRVP